MKKTTVCLTALFVCCTMLLPTAAANKIEITSDEEELEFVEHDAVSGKDTNFTLDDLDDKFDIDSPNSVAKYDSAAGGYYTEPVMPEWVKSDDNMMSAGAGTADPDNVISGSPYSRVTDVKARPYCMNTLILCRWDHEGEGSVYATATGFMVGQKVMVTAGHVFWDPSEGGYPTEVRIFVRYDKSGNYYSLNNETDYYHPKAWVLSANFTTSTPNKEYDWCYVTLFTPVGKTITGYYGMSSYDVPKNKEIILSGYPADYKNYSYEMFHQYKSSGLMNKYTDYTVTHTCSTREGHSGSALSSVNYVAWGIHTAGINPKLNGGVRFAPYLYKLIVNKINSTNE